LGKDGVAQTVATPTGVDPETARKIALAHIGGLATGRMTTPEEVATLVVMLASPRTANVTARTTSSMAASSRHFKRGPQHLQL